MKSLVVLLILITAVYSSSSFSAQTVCTATRGAQIGDTLPTSARLSFDYTNNTISDVSGYVFVKNQWEDDSTEYNEENSYRGYFDIASLTSNPDYRPNKYKNHQQFQKFDATHTDGQEDGMWGNLVIAVTTESSFNAYYIFQAGDHMGGTIHFKCVR